MDKEQAKFILESYRPDGADAHGGIFAEALQLAVEDRELGEWLSNQRSEDAEFAKNLQDFAVPELLRRRILAVMSGQLPLSEEEEAMDSAFSSAFEGIDPPAGLRDQILMAMDVQSGKTEPNTADVPVSVTKVVSISKWKMFSGGLAVAAALVLGGFLAIQVSNSPVAPTSNVSVTNVPTANVPTGNVSAPTLTSYDVQQMASGILNTNFKVDAEISERAGINNWLVARNLPIAGDESLPDSLLGYSNLGCKIIALPDSNQASLVCFKVDGGAVHVVIMKNYVIGDKNLPVGIDEVTEKSCYYCPKSGWDVARWQDDENTFIMLAKTGDKPVENVLKYF